MTRNGPPARVAARTEAWRPRDAIPEPDVSPPVHVAFLATSRSGLGHLRRIANIAGHLARSGRAPRLTLITNAEPAGLGAGDMACFSRLEVCETARMSTVLSESSVSLAVADTMALPGIGRFGGRTALILRETPQDRLERFRRDDGRAWDCVIVPNAVDHWMPALGPGFARRVEAAGWILRPTGARGPGEPGAGIVLATGGGGTADTRAQLYPMLARLLAGAKARSRTGFPVRQALGPRSGGQAVPGVDAVFDPGGDLNRLFRRADLVISTAGYNSVLELASTDTPALILPIPRSLDDQAARVRTWGARLGFGLVPGRMDAAVEWLADHADRPRRRPPVDLGPDGARRAAGILLDLTCPVS